MPFSSISFIGQATSQINQIKNLRSQLVDTQRQITTQKKSDTLSGLGTDALRVQRLRGDANQLAGFNRGIDTTLTRIQLMSGSMQQISDTGRTVLDGLRVQVQEGEIEIGAVNTMGTENLKFLSDLINTQIGGRYLFAGSDIVNAPHDTLTTLNTNIQSEISDWLDGSQSVNQFLTDVQALTGTALGYSPSLQGADEVHVRADFDLEVDYTVKGDEQGFQDLFIGMALAANLQFPGAGDVATEAEFHQVLGQMEAILARGAEAVDTLNFGLGNKAALLQNVRERHATDEGVFRVTIEKVENIDPAEAIARFQAIETQLTASYEVTSLVNQLTLVNFI